MSYNIDAWRIRSLRLVLPKKFNFGKWLDTQPARDARGYENVGVRWCREERDSISVSIDPSDQTWSLELMNQSLSGEVTDEGLVTTEIDWRDEGSGHLYSDILLPLFQTFHGSINALVVWEHGDSIVQLTIQDGIITQKEID